MTRHEQGLSVRKRKIYHLTASVGSKLKSGSPTGSSVIYNGTQETASEGHRWPPRLGEHFYDRGGPFYTRRSYLKRWKAVDVYGVGNDPLPGVYEYAFVKNAMPQFLMSNLSTLLPETSSTTLTNEGTKALNQMRPTAPLSGLGVTIGELREGLPSLIGSGLLKSLMGDARSRRRLLKKGSDEYLNWEFGWKPLIADLHDASKAVIQSHKIIEQLHRDSGRDVRRRFGYPVTKDTSLQITSGVYPQGPGITYLWDAPGKLYASTTTSRNVWVSGMCRYYIPEQSDTRLRIQRQAQEANRLLGLRPDPELLWQLAPWSWLADWVTDVGALVGNYTSFAFDGLVWKYAYLMEHQQVVTKYDLVGHRTFNGASPTCSATLVRESKRRVTSSPFGFGLDLDGFTLRQWSILAALGISRGNL